MRKSLLRDGIEHETPGLDALGASLFQKICIRGSIHDGWRWRFTFLITER
jgi:hypothetical protein